jgi:hypothetical protein
MKISLKQIDLLKVYPADGASKPESLTNCAHSLAIFAALRDISQSIVKFRGKWQYWVAGGGPGKAKLNMPGGVVEKGWVKNWAAVFKS